jgi:hypothetical protein
MSIESIILSQICNGCRFTSIPIFLEEAEVHRIIRKFWIWLKSNLMIMMPVKGAHQCNRIKEPVGAVPILVVEFRAAFIYSEHTQNGMQ